MKTFSLWAAFAASLPVMVWAQVPAVDAAMPDAPVPRPAFRSAFEGLPTGVEEGTADWKGANAQVAGFPRGHADWLRWEEQQGSARPAAAPPPAPARGAAPAGPVKPDPAPARPAQSHRH